MGTPHKPRGPKPQRYTFNVTCMTKDNQLAVCTPMVLYHCTAKMDAWFHPLSAQLERLVDAYVAETYLYDVTTDRNAPKELLKKLTELIKTALKGPNKPTPTIKIEDVSITIKRDR